MDEVDDGSTQPATLGAAVLDGHRTTPATTAQAYGELMDAKKLLRHTPDPDAWLCAARDELRSRGHDQPAMAVVTLGAAELIRRSLAEADRTTTNGDT